LVTRSDFDGLVCAALLGAAGIVDTCRFVHPKDPRDGKAGITENDVLANVPFVPECGLWFDHHSSETSRQDTAQGFAFEKESRIVSSCARVIYDCYGGTARFAKFDASGLMAVVDKCDSGQSAVAEVMDPGGWILLGFVLDPCTGLGYYKNYRIGNLQLMMDMIHYCRTMTAEEILQQPDVQERVERYFAQETAYELMIKNNSAFDGNVLITHLLNLAETVPGNRFKEYALFPEVNISLRITWANSCFATAAADTLGSKPAKFYARTGIGAGTRSSGP
jgi:hypothetical protein